MDPPGSGDRGESGVMMEKKDSRRLLGCNGDDREKKWVGRGS